MCIASLRKNVKFCSWNICGLYDHKLCDDMLGPFLKLHDVIFITETWACDTDHFRLEGYVYHNFSRKIKHPNAKRNSGGIGIFIRKEMVEGIEIKKCIDDVVVWVKLNGNFFGTIRDIYIAVAYIVPEGSTHSRHDPFALLHDEIASIPQGAELCYVAIIMPTLILRMIIWLKVYPVPMESLITSSVVIIQGDMNLYVNCQKIKSFKDSPKIHEAWIPMADIFLSYVRRLGY